MQLHDGEWRAVQQHRRAGGLPCHSASGEALVGTGTWERCAVADCFDIQSSFSFDSEVSRGSRALLLARSNCWSLVAGGGGVAAPGAAAELPMANGGPRPFLAMCLVAERCVCGQAQAEAARAW
jgi:hypothetical protein